MNFTYICNFHFDIYFIGVVILIDKNGEIIKEKDNASNGSIEVSTELITDIKGVKGPNYSAMITMDGNINFYYKLKKEWTLQVNSQLFAISKIDCTNGKFKINFIEI